jgi:putative flippase GtrA
MLKRQLRIFVIVGLLATLVDFLIYRNLVFFSILDVHLAKGLSFLTGTLFSYLANRFWTFGHQSHHLDSLWRFLLLYAVTLGTNVLLNAYMLGWLAGLKHAVLFAFLVATSISAACNFLGMKLFVFKTRFHQPSL